MFTLHSTNRSSGFTLIEIIVSLAIFTIVAVVAVGAFLKIVDANKKSQSLKTAINNINFALESMTREMRVGSLYKCINSESDVSNIYSSNDLTNSQTSCPSTNYNGVVFLSSRLLTTGSGAPCTSIHAYLFEGTTFKKGEQTACGQAISLPFTPVISPDAVIDEHDFFVTNQNSGTGIVHQPKAFIHIKGHSGVQVKSQTYFDVQTTISQRNPF